MSGSTLLRTPLHDLHIDQGARMVPFAGYEMPVQYPAGILKEHQHTRAKAGLFDVSHMGQIHIRGQHAAAQLERLVPVDVVSLGEFRQRYALLTNDSGGILDDLMVTNMSDHLLLVVNAACKNEDIRHISNHVEGVEVIEDHALLALQGPEAGNVLARICPESSKLVFMTAAQLSIDGVTCCVTRSGYTGEDGFEISIPSESASAVAKRLLSEAEVEPIGLGARDTLRLEAGLCLYGHDIDTGTTPVEANLSWALSKSRRRNGARPGGYPGFETIQTQLEQGVSRLRVGLCPEGRAPLREGVELLDHEERPVGRITSGGFGPSVGRPVAMGYVSTAVREPGTRLNAMVRNKPVAVNVEKLPFVSPRYFKG